MAVTALEDGFAFLTSEQTEWVRTQRAIAQARLAPESSQPPVQRWRRPLYRAATSVHLEVCITCVIVVNIVALGSYVYAPDWDGIAGLLRALLVVNGTCIILYALEALLKMLGLGLVGYFSRGWNIFDFLILIIGLLDAILLAFDASLPLSGPLLRGFRLFRLARLLRLFRTARVLRQMIETVVLSLPAVANVSALLLLLLYVYAIFATNLFWAVNYTPDDGSRYSEAGGEAGLFPGDYRFHLSVSNDGLFVNRHANFRNLGTSVMTLVRCITGESYNGIMHESMGAEWGTNALRCCSQCGPLVDGAPVSSCGRTFASILLFMSFQLILTYVIVPLFIGVFMENYDEVGGAFLKHVSLDHLDDFRKAWASIDTGLTRFIPSSQLLPLLFKLHHPLGFADRHPPPSRADQLKHLAALDIPDRNGRVFFTEVLAAVAYAVCGVEVPDTCATQRLQRTFREQARRQHHGLRDLPTVTSSAHLTFLVVQLQAHWRGRAARRRRMHADSADLAHDDTCEAVLAASEGASRLAARAESLDSRKVRGAGARLIRPRARFI